MVKEMTWDSALFGRKMGEFVPASQSASSIDTALRKAAVDGFRYVICRLKSQDTRFMRLLEAHGFYLTDIGVTLGMKGVKFLQEYSATAAGGGSAVRVATDSDLPELKKMVKGLFTDSRFYHDPFFTKEEADRLYQTWIENSLKGEAADIVFFMPGRGFISCRKSKKNTGEIVLLGVRKKMRGAGFGSALVAAGMRWFSEQNIESVTVRTQLKNLKALNFYLARGFSPQSYDVIFARTI